MIYLNPNQANQTIYLSLFEGRYTLADFTHYMIGIIHEENSENGESLYQVPTIVSDGSRITELTLTTAGLETKGRYRYIVYGQNSAVNTNPSDASVVGIVEIGYMVLNDSHNYYDTIATSTPNDIIIGT